MFEDVENLEDEEKAKKEYLRQMKDRFLSREEFMASEAKKVSAEYDKAKNLLDSNRVWQSLVTCEDKIARQAARLPWHLNALFNIFHINKLC